jgi:hypothetical protein
MAVHYPDTIVWSPDSANVAFMAMTRAGQTTALPTPTPAENQTDNATNSESNANLNTMKTQARIRKMRIWSQRANAARRAAESRFDFSHRANLYQHRRRRAI